MRHNKKFSRLKAYFTKLKQIIRQRLDKLSSALSEDETQKLESLKAEEPTRATDKKLAIAVIPLKSVPKNIIEQIVAIKAQAEKRSVQAIEEKIQQYKTETARTHDQSELRFTTLKKQIENGIQLRSSRALLEKRLEQSERAHLKGIMSDHTWAKDPFERAHKELDLLTEQQRKILFASYALH